MVANDGKRRRMGRATVANSGRQWWTVWPSVPVDSGNQQWPMVVCSGQRQAVGDGGGQRRRRMVVDNGSGRLSMSIKKELIGM